jgi:pilus assembly protein FimV
MTQGGTIVSKTIVVRTLAALLLFASFAASAAGLGTLRVLSALGQPLRAEIDIVSLRGGEQDSLSVRLASSEAFRQAGIEFHPALIGIKMTVQRRDGQPIVAVTSRGPVNEPFLEMLVELEWSTGRLVREYTILLDPPTYIPPPPAGAVMGPTAPAAAAAAPPQPMTPATPEPTTAAPVTAAVDYEVVKGDTLSQIARDHMHSGVTFNQMMIAIYQANQEAFILENINLVRAGRILRIPDRDTVAAVGREEAKETVLEHMASFAEYRRKIAAAAPTVPESAGTRTAEGEIKSPGGEVAPEPTKDQLKLSRAEPGKPGGPGAAAATADDLAARDRELQEAQSRVDDLEKNVTDLQKLLEIKNQQIAELEKRAEESTAAPVSKPAAEAPKPAVEAPKPSAEAPKPAVEAPKPIAEAPKPKPAPAKPAAKPRPAPPAPAPEASLLDEYLGDPLAIGGLAGVILLLVGYGAYAWKRKKRAAKTELGDSLLGVAAGGAAAAGAGAAAAAGGIGMPEAEEVDPLAEADVYLAYGRDAQAEEILREALQKDASRPAVHAKLLEIFAKRRDAKEFESTALKLKALVKGEGPEWDKAMALGRSIDPGNGLYGEGEAAPVASNLGAAGTPPVDFNIEATSTGIDRKAPDLTLDFDLGGATSEEPAAAEAAEAPEGEGRKVDITGPLDFDLGTTTTEKPSAPEPEASAAAPGAAGGLDFELSVDTGEQPSAVGEASGATSDLGMISLDLGGAESDGAAPGGGDAKWQEVATKLDLAKAYEEMGDKDGARELLNEVAREGDAAQQAQAQQMLASLG